MSIDARLAYEVWLQLIAEEELARATLEGSHRALAAKFALDPAKLEVLDDFHSQRGTRWNIENLRFRTAMEAGSTLSSYMPRTMRLLTNGDQNWLQDITFEYLAFYKWAEHGGRRFTECERFGRYTRERIAKRRILPDHFDVVLEFELAVIRMLKSTANVPADAWPGTPPTLTDEQLADLRLQRAPVVDIVELPVDIREWVMSGDPRVGTPREQPVTLLMFVPSLQEVHRIKVIGEGPKLALEQFDGTKTTGQVAASLYEDYGIEPGELNTLVRAWLAERVLAVPSKRANVQDS
jgi:hypothetical protein